MEFSGRLASFPIGDILQWGQNDRRSGALVVRRSGTEKRIYLRDGDIVACHSDDAAEYFGQHLLVKGLLDEAALIEALTRCRKRGGLLGEVLVELELLGPEQLRAALRDHVQDQVCDLFLWKTGIFYVTGESVPRDQMLPEPLPAAAVALEGARRADEHERMRRLFVHDHVVLVRGKQAPEAASPLGWRILEKVDGNRNLRELYAEVRGSWFRFLEAAYGLTVDGALDIGDVREPSDSHSTEFRLADLLLEQLAVEQASYHRTHPAIPFDALEEMRPVWVRPIEAAEAVRMSTVVRAFYEEIDGRRTVADLFGDIDDEERTRRLDRLVLQLRKGSLALLPPGFEVRESPPGDKGAASAGRPRRVRAVNR